MADGAQCEFPVIVLLLDRVRRVGVDEARRVVRAVLGDEAGATVRPVAENSTSMSYIEWQLEATPYHLGTSSEPYINAVGEGKVDSENRLIGPLKWTRREEIPPQGEELCAAWMSHTAWLYVDALLFHSQPAADILHIRNVFRVASHFVDERCVLLWRWGGEPKGVALPSTQAVAALQAGEWPT